ncbi:MAG: glycosyltransferase family 39 protein [bacterium]|nr:glycosyltransferase family 39 protein [bacterium]
MNRARYVRLAALIAVIVLAALPTITYPLGRDQGEFATIGRGLLDGRAPYVDLWNPKPPAVFYVYAGAMALFGRNVPALRAVDLVLFPLIALCLWWIGQRLQSARAGEWAVLLFGAFYFTETFWTLTQNDGIALLPMALAGVCALQALDAARTYPSSRRMLAWAFAAGACCGLAFWFKYPFALFGGLLAFGAALAVGANTARLFASGIAFTLGGALVVAAGAGAMMALGAWEALIESARVTAGYTALGFNPDEFQRGFSTALGTRAAHWGVLFAVAALFPFATRRRDRGTPLDPYWRIVHCWTAAAVAILLIQAKGYDYHWLPLLPPLTLYGAAAIDTIITHLSLNRWIGRVAVIGVFAILPLSVGGRTFPYLAGREDQAAYFARFRAGEFSADESLRVADYLRARVAPGDSLFIWGFRPEVYYLSQLNPAVRFIFQFPLVADWYPAAWRDETVEILWAALPPYVLVLQVDYLDWVTGRPNMDSNQLLQEYPALNDWLIFNYQPDTQIGNFFVWQRRSP